MTLSSVRWEGGPSVREDGWSRVFTWRTQHGRVDLWSDQYGYGPVRVTGEGVPAAVLRIEPVAETKRQSRGRGRAEGDLVVGVAAEIEDRAIAFSMPRRGVLRCHRTLFVTIDGMECRYRPRSVGSSELIRPDETPILRTRIWRGPLLDDDATPLEVTVAGLCYIADFHARVTRNVIYAL